eukprot:4177074-Pleurochrysis_carterae.AAC.2
MRRSTCCLTFRSSVLGDAGSLTAGVTGWVSVQRSTVGCFSLQGEFAREGFGSRVERLRESRSVVSVRYVRYAFATGRPGNAACPMCNAQNTLAFARSQTADSMWPLMIATQAEVSSRSAASEKLV